MLSLPSEIEHSQRANLNCLVLNEERSGKVQICQGNLLQVVK